MHIVNPLEVGRKHQSNHTGLIHYGLKGPEGAGGLPIPVYENFLFALALFKSRLSEHVLEARQIIERLLAFEVDGNFPLCLSDYPKCQDPYLSLKIYPVLFWLLRDFSHVCGSLCGKMQALLERIQGSFCNHDPLCPWVEMRLSAMEGRIDAPYGCKSSYDWSQSLISFQLAQKLGKIDLQPFLDEAFGKWHQDLEIYVGPSSFRHQQGYFPPVTLFDLYMGFWKKEVKAKRFSQMDLSTALQSALIRPLKGEISVEKKQSPYIHFDSQEGHPLFIAWKEKTLVLAKKHLIVTEEKREPLSITLAIDTPEDEVVQVFINSDPEDIVLVEGQKSTIFQKEQKLTFLSNGRELILSFAAPDGTYLGRISKGNRPAQHLCKGEKIFTAYDWCFSIETIKKGRDPIQVHLEVAQKLESPQQLPLHASHCLHTTLSQ